MAQTSLKKQLQLVFLVPITFFIVSILTLSDYGISWDEPIHFSRGQAYLNYILTGKTLFNEDEIGSAYQSNNLPAEYFLQKDDGHPPLNGILAAVSNQIFYQKLGILGDVESYHLFNVLASTLLVFIVVLFAKETYGTFAALVAGLAVSTYPLFFAESHFNIKDPAQAAFYTLFIWSTWKLISQKKPLWILVSSLGFGLALGTKFNILFSPLIILPYLVLRYHKTLFTNPSHDIKSLITFIKVNYKVFVTSILVIVILVFGAWPFLWQDPIDNFIFIIKWYKDIGTGPAAFGYILPFGFNAFAPIWIVITTPPIVLFLSLAGFFFAIKKFKENNYAPSLWLLWFTVPIARVVLPDTTIYGGSRQIMEFLPAMALLAGFGAYSMVESSKGLISKKFVQIILLILFIPQLFVLTELHPNENVYFNTLIGGLKGAKAANVPYWGNSLGNAYLQAVNWINANAEPRAKVALVQGTSVNIPRITLRKDIAYSNSYWTGIYRGGEYLVELTHNDLRYYPYAWEYIEKFLIPVHEVKVNGVTIAKVWKNDLDHTTPKLKGKETVLNDRIVKTQNGQEIILDLGKEFVLSRLVVNYSENDCSKINSRVSTSKNLEDWNYEKEEIPVTQVFYQENEEKPFEPFFFAGTEARYIKVEDYTPTSCLLQAGTRFKVYRIEDLR